MFSESAMSKLTNSYSQMGQAGALIPMSSLQSWLILICVFTWCKTCQDWNIIGKMNASIKKKVI